MKSYYVKSLVAVALFVGVGALALKLGGPPVASTATAEPAQSSTSNPSPNLAVATLAGGCFWCVEATFEKLAGVEAAVSGYTGGHTANPTYYDVGQGDTGHTEAVQIHYDPAVISYAGLLHYFWREIDPTDSGGQFVDRGSMYRPAIFYHSEAEKAIATASRDALVASGRFDKPLTIEIAPLETFYPAEDYHQDYYKTSALRYQVYRRGSGRDQYLEKTWGDELHAKFPGAAEPAADSAQSTQPTSHDYSQYKKPAEAELKNTLSAMQYRITQRDGTEPPFRNEYWDNKSEGIYVDIVSGEPLFSSTDKFRSGTGWPSFSQPIDAHFVVEKVDYKLLYPRTELRSKYGDSHLGHVFNDGPAPTGLRYCINSAALKFIPKAELAQQGYAQYVALFAKQSALLQ